MIHKIYKRFKSQGFALVVTLSLMVLLAILAVGLLSLSSVSLRAAGQGSAQAVAQANARMAMMLAIGELQKSLGRDGSITAPAGILDENPETPAPDGVTHPHLTGVWVARQEKLGDTPDYDRGLNFKSWLVSNSQPEQLGKIDFVRSGGLTEPVTLAHPPSRADAGSGKVQAGRVRTPRGGFAWWVGDENCKARVAEVDQLDRREDAGVADLLASFATPGTHGVRAVEGFENFPSNTVTSDKVITRNQLALATAKEALAEGFFHDLSPYPESVLANVTNDSLRKDLSLYLERSDIDWLEGWGLAQGRTTLPTGPLGPNEDLALSHPRNYDTLSWKSLHHWYNMHRRQIGAGAGFPMIATNDEAPLDKVSNPTWNSGVPRITPLLVRMQMILSYWTVDRGPHPTLAGKRNFDLYLASYPALTVWNPYNVKLQVDEWSVFLHNLPLEHTIYQNGIKVDLTGLGTADGNYVWGWRHGNMSMSVGTDGRVSSPALTFDPGEAKTLTYTTAFSGNHFPHAMVQGIQPWIPASATPPRHVGFERKIGTVAGNPSDRIAIETHGKSWESSGNSSSFLGANGFQQTFAFRCQLVAIDTLYEHPAQMFCSQVSFRHEKVNPVAGFLSKDNFPSMTLGELDNAPNPFVHLDMRLKTLDEVQLPNKTWLHNLPTHPYASSTSTQKHSAQGVDAATTFFAHPFQVAFEQISGIEGLLQSKPFFGPSNRPGGRGKIVAREIPLVPLTSLAQLQNLPQYPIEALNYSGYHYQNYAIGNSYASPGLLPAQIKWASFPFYLGEYLPWQASLGGDLAGKLYNGVSWFNNADYSIAHAPAAIIDRSYAANQLLFDDYFFSSMAAQQGPVFRNYGTERTLRQVVEDFAKGTRALPNAAYRLNLGGADANSLADSLITPANKVAANAHLRAAAHLMASGGFNVNSTSVPAWKAMLASAHLKRPVTMDAGGKLVAQTGARFVVSRFNTPIGVAADNQPGAASEENRWLGYRELTEAEIGQLAEAVVAQVKKRGPFRSLGEFVNRRLTTDPELARYGAVQAALEDPKVTINDNYRSNLITQADIQGGKYKANYPFPEAALGSRYQGTPAYISQADILTPLAPLINVRSDTFLIRAYGEARSTDGGKILARAWCEAVVQRVPEYIEPKDEAFTPRAALTSAANATFGRRFLMKSFSWIANPETESGAI